MEFIFGLVRWILIIVLLGVILFRIFRIIRPFETGLVERLGKFNREASPGLNIVLPGLERIIIVDMREQVIDVPPQEVITKDNVTITVDAVIYYEPTDPKKLVIKDQKKAINKKVESKSKVTTSKSSEEKQIIKKSVATKKTDSKAVKKTSTTKKDDTLKSSATKTSSKKK